MKTKYTAEQLAAMLRGAQLTVRVNTAQLGRDDVTTRASAREVAAIKAISAKSKFGCDPRRLPPRAPQARQIRIILP